MLWQVGRPACWPSRLIIRLTLTQLGLAGAWAELGSSNATLQAWLHQNKMRGSQSIFHWFLWCDTDCPHFLTDCNLCFDGTSILSPINAPMFSVLVAVVYIPLGLGQSGQLQHLHFDWGYCWENRKTSKEIVTTQTKHTTQSLSSDTNYTGRQHRTTSSGRGQKKTLLWKSSIF